MNRTTKIFGLSSPSIKPKKSRNAAENSEVDKVMDSNGNTKLILAAYRGQTEEVINLLAEGADVNATNNDGKTAADF